jgi:uncharacterized protein YcfL
MSTPTRASFALAAVIAAGLSVAGCKTTNTVSSTQRIITDPILDLDASAAQVRTSRVAGDLLQAQVDLYNTWITEQDVKYKWEWIDAAGNVLPNATSTWAGINIAAKQTYTLTAVAPSPRAVDFRLQIRRAGN